MRMLWFPADLRLAFDMFSRVSMVSQLGAVRPSRLRPRDGKYCSRALAQYARRETPHEADCVKPLRICEERQHRKKHHPPYCVRQFRAQMSDVPKVAPQLPIGG